MDSRAIRLTRNAATRCSGFSQASKSVDDSGITASNVVQIRMARCTKRSNTRGWTPIRQESGKRGNQSGCGGLESWRSHATKGELHPFSSPVNRLRFLACARNDKEVVLHFWRLCVLASWRGTLISFPSTRREFVSAVGGALRRPMARGRRRRCRPTRSSRPDSWRGTAGGSPRRSRIRARLRSRW